MSSDKTADLLGVLICRSTSFEFSRHIHISLRQATTFDYDVKIMFSIIFSVWENLRTLSKFFLPYCLISNSELLAPSTLVRINSPDVK